MMAWEAEGVCCPGAPAKKRCDDGTTPTPFCGVGSCDWMGCCCKGGCRRGSPRRRDIQQDVSISEVSKIHFT